MPRKKAEPIDVLVVDDQRTFAEALTIAVGLEQDLSVHVVSTGEDAIATAGRERPDVVLMDVEMPGVGGIEATRRILEADPDTKVIVLSSHDEDLVKARAVEAGAVGFLSKFSPMEEVAEAVRRAYQQESLMEQHEKNRLYQRLRHQRHQEATERQRANRLTPRQIEIMQLMAEGASMREIGERLHVSPATLRTHVQNILTRLGVHTKVEALALAIRQDKVRARP
jgi:DNA-binding NarL/FixJ family response regulator